MSAGIFQWCEFWGGPRDGEAFYGVVEDRDYEACEMNAATGRVLLLWRPRW